jgi:hypothetical protein
MKCIKIIGAAFILAAMTIPALEAQTSLKGMSLNGSTGLYSIPSGRVGWERDSDFAIDFGYHAIVTGEAAHIPKINFSLFKLIELHAAFDVQHPNRDKDTDFITGLKLQLPITSSSTAIAFGGNFQAIKQKDEYRDRLAGQVYAAVSYAGRFFDMPAETTITLGKTFLQNNNNSDIDFGMGFDLILFPQHLKNVLHWITDYANFSYSADPWRVDAWYRGVLNTGFRIDLAAIPALSKFKFVIDIVMTDAFDSTRAFSTGAVFGIPIM